MPIEKFAAASTPMPARDTTFLSAGSCACQPVVPITTLMPRAGELGKVVRHRVGHGEIDRHIDLAEVCRSEIARCPDFSSITPTICAS